MQALEIANLVALQQTEWLSTKLDRMIETTTAQPEDFTATWHFKGTKYFIQQHEALAPHREWLLQLIAAVEGENRAAILNGLRQAQADLSTTP